MVVLCKVFGQLETCELVTCGNPPHETSDFEVDQVTVCRATGQLRELVGDVADAHRSTGGHQQVDDGTAPTGVALVHPAESCFNHVVQIVAGRPD
jgi:hypothetical protein